ncbi:MAG TPA: hypothetical protein PL045_01710 [Chitinophagaceae bacterium]|nr:hypothetical protein [Chitinophagaceae bacterium]
MHQKNHLPFYWGMLHGVNDWVAGYMLAHASISMQPQQSFMALIVYAVLGFGGQLPAGMWLDSNKNLKAFATVSALCLVIACLLFFQFPFAAIVAAGIASAGIHVTGGAVCLLISNEKSSMLGIFTSPGVAGLAWGGFSGFLQSSFLLIPLACTAVLFVLILKAGFPSYSTSPRKEAALDTHDWIMLLLLLVISLRSFLFDLVNNFAQYKDDGLIVIGFAAFAGKLIGGFAADKIGWKKWVYITLPLAIIFLQLGRENITLLAFGVACLQSSVPLTLMLMYKSIPQFPATAGALSLGAAIALAGLPLYASPLVQNIFKTSDSVYASIIWGVVFLLLALFIFFRKKLWTLEKQRIQ